MDSCLSAWHLRHSTCHQLSVQSDLVFEIITLKIKAKQAYIKCKNYANTLRTEAERMEDKIEKDKLGAEVT